MDHDADNERVVRADDESNIPTKLLPAGGAMERSFTPRALVSGLIIGLLVNLSNIYYGLQTGVSNQLSMVSGLLGYVGFKLFSRYTTMQFSAAENVLIISVATATGCIYDGGMRSDRHY
jgi:uncharacterized oligopeptide transporter (OPT) family protein